MHEKPLRFLIVEDDISFAIELEMLVESIEYEVVGRVDNSEEALAIALEKMPDIILMDISIKGKYNGIEVADRLKKLPIGILFITSHKTEEHFHKAKDTNFVGYLGKPVDKYSIQSAIELAVKALQSRMKIRKAKEHCKQGTSHYMYFKKRGIYQKVVLGDILYIKADGDYSTTYTVEGTFTTSIRLQEFEELLTTAFVRVHRSYIVNKTKITSIDTENNNIYINKETIPYSRRVKEDLFKDIRFIK